MEKTLYTLLSFYNTSACKTVYSTHFLHKNAKHVYLPFCRHIFVSPSEIYDRDPSACLSVPFGAFLKLDGSHYLTFI
jgi:hypothetical protein